MKKALYPDEYLPSAYAIDFATLYQEGFRSVIFDIDNTLVPHGAPADERAIRFFTDLERLGFSAVLLSNNKEPRVRMFLSGLATREGTVRYIHKAGKPKRAGYLRAMELMGTDCNTTLFVGDQIFTDIWGANRAGIYTILVKRIHPREEIQIILKRALELFVLAGYRIDCKLGKRPMRAHEKEEQMKIAIANDHTGVELKNTIKEYVESMGHTVTNFGTDETGPDNYAEYGEKVGRAVASGEYDCGILICGTGVGISLAANKVKGIRAAVCSEPVTAALVKRHNNANIIAFGARIVGSEMAKEIVKAYLTAKFEGGRHQERIAYMMAIERRN